MIERYFPDHTARISLEQIPSHQARVSPCAPRERICVEQDREAFCPCRMQVRVARYTRSGALLRLVTRMAGVLSAKSSSTSSKFNAAPYKPLCPHREGGDSLRFSFGQRAPDWKNRWIDQPCCSPVTLLRKRMRGLLSAEIGRDVNFAIESVTASWIRSSASAEPWSNLS